MSKFKFEPALLGAAVVAILNALVGFGVLDMSTEAIAGVNTAIVSFGAVFVRKQTTTNRYLESGEYLGH